MDYHATILEYLKKKKIICFKPTCERSETGCMQQCEVSKLAWISCTTSLILHTTPARSHCLHKQEDQRGPRQPLCSRCDTCQHFWQPCLVLLSSTDTRGLSPGNQRSILKENLWARVFISISSAYERKAVLFGQNMFLEGCSIPSTASHRQRYIYRWVSDAKLDFEQIQTVAPAELWINSSNWRNKHVLIKANIVVVYQNKKLSGMTTKCLYCFAREVVDLER